MLSKKRTNKVLIGKDTRISGYMLEAALEAGLAAADTKQVARFHANASGGLFDENISRRGIVISASHNPYYDNGIKFFRLKGLN